MLTWKSFVPVLLAIVISTVISVYCVDYATDLRGGDLCQLALDREFPTQKPLIRRWHLEKQIKGDRLYLVEYQFGSENETPHLTHVLIKENLKTKLITVR
jgi:hypothetical protein